MRIMKQQIRLKALGEVATSPGLRALNSSPISCPRREGERSDDRNSSALRRADMWGAGNT
jgi:hypothetical protein